ncbi:RidA family protein [Methanobacterium sp. CWC-01]|uniref:RidA family protein n=1 Tax=Methanobacterium aridiramus TaxID=2584467 RepID=UPI0025781FE5|nr:RidA family protein [Methanobacterium sp. CWC-01]WJI10007.1 RidA family protein [Methanobacterium sp. CWC-01]
MVKIDYINPHNMARPRGYSHAISVTGSHRTIYIGGQNAIDEKGNLIGKDSLKKQTKQVLTNILKVLEKSDAKLENVVKFNIYLVQGQNPQDGFEVFQQIWGDNQVYPTITVLFVAGLGHPDWLVEIDAVAIVP